MYRDAFAPPQDTRRPKPWERSSVPAHAPRLQGQKIWKKAGIQIQNNKENEASLLELQSEGNGARKKRKVWAAKENIGHAPWKNALSAWDPFIHNQDNAEDNNGDNESVGGRHDVKDDTLRFVPRKRTNTDHVITPRKPLRQTHLNSQAQTLSAVPNDALSNISTRRKKSMRRSSIRRSTSMRVSARFTSGNGPAQISEDPESSALPVQQPSETASQFMFGTDPSMGNQSVEDESKTYQPAKAQEVRESDKLDIDSPEPSTVKHTKGPKGRKRSSVRRDSKRSSRSSVPLASITEDLPAQLDQTIGKAGSGLILDQDLRNFSDAGVPSGDGSTRRDGREAQNPIQFGVSNETVGSIAPAKNQLEQAPAEQHAHDLQQVVQVAESADRISRIESASTTLGPSPEQLQRTDAEEQSQTADSITSHNGSPYKAADGLEMEPAEQVAEIYSPQDENPSTHDVHVPHLADGSAGVSSSLSKVNAVGISEDLETGIQPRPEDTSTLDSITVAVDEVLQSLPAESSASQPVLTLPDNTTPSAAYEDDDTDMLRKFLTRVKANKAAKAESATPQRKRSLPHSPLRLPLGDVDSNASPSPLSLKPKDDHDINAPSPSPKRRKRNESATDKEQAGELKTIRRSGRTRLPVKATPSAPSLIPVRRLGQDGDSTVTLRRSEEKETAALTRVNTRKNKGALSPTEVLLLKAAEKTDPVLKQRLLKEMFEEKQKKKGDTSETGKNVAWAKELAQFQCEKEIKAKEKTGPGSAEKKTNAVRLGAARNKIALRKTVNGTPGPKRRTRDLA